MLEVRDVRVSFGDTPVLRGVSLEVAQGEIVCLLGPSGCGKTTLLRVIAGLEQPQSGDVWFDGQSVLNVPIHRRGFGLMFQDFALFPHMNVAQNVAFGLKMLRVPPAERDRRVRDALELVGLQGFEQRDVARLSGGERQRVALARSLAPNPRLLMLDEPLGSLDAALRERLVVELREIIRRVGLTAVYVTHDQHEAFAIADRMAVMNAGVIEQIGTPQAVYTRPVSTFVARFLGLNNIVPVLRQQDDTAQTALGNFHVSAPADALLLHPDGIELSDPNAPGAIAGSVEECVYLGDSYRLQLRAADGISLMFKLPAVNHLPHVGDLLAVQPARVLPLANGRLG
ncbi:MAG: ABC transporter ATP-binding protein [Chloroflexi bacterium]|nr:ABC transporter ATP-binding protein [Chloroflexota bacterium]